MGDRAGQVWVDRENSASTGSEFNAGVEQAPARPTGVSFVLECVAFIPERVALNPSESRLNQQFINNSSINSSTTNQTTINCERVH